MSTSSYYTLFRNNSVYEYAADKKEAKFKLSHAHMQQLAILMYSRELWFYLVIVMARHVH